MALFSRPAAFRQIGIRQRSLRKHCRSGRATELVLVLTAGALLVLGGPAQAQAVWDGTTDTDVTKRSNYVGDISPNGNAFILDNAAAPNQPRLDLFAGTFTPSSVAVSAGTLTLDDVLSFAGRNVTVSGGELVILRFGAVEGGGSSITTSGTGRLTLDGIAQSEIVNGGTLVIGAAGWVLTNNVTSSGTGTNNGAGSRSGIDGTLDVTGGTFTNAGRIGDATTVSGGTLNLNPGSNLIDALTVSGGLVNVSASDSFESLTVRGGAITGGILTGRANATLTVDDMSLGGRGINAATGTTLTLVSTGNFRAPELVTIGSIDNQGTVVLTPQGTTETTTTSSLFIQRGTLALGNENALRPFSAGELTRIGAGATLDLSGFGITLRRLTGDGTITSSLPGSVVLTLSEDVARIFDGVISDGAGNVAVTKTGSGRTTLSGTNTYSGLTTVSAGTLEVSNDAGLGASGAGSGTTVAAGATLALSGVTPGGITTNEAITLNGAGVSNGGALRNLSGQNTVTGAITLGSATRITSDANRLVLQGDITGNQNLTLGGAGEIFIDGNIETGSGSVTIDNTGYVRFGGMNTFTGALAVNAGVLELGSGSDLADSVPVQVASGARLRLRRSATFGNLSGAGIIQFNGPGITLTLGDATDSTFSGTLDGSSNIGSLTKQGTGTLTLSGSNTIEGTTTITAGTLRVTGGAAIANGGAVSVGAAGTFDVAQSEAIRALEGAGSVTIASGQLLTTVGDDSTTFSGVISGAGALFKLGNGTLTLSGANTHTGRTIVNTGTLDVTGSVASGVVLIEGSGRVIAHGNSISDSSVIELATSTATLDLRGDETIGVLRNGGVVTIAGIVELGANTLTLAGTGSNYLGAINGTGSLVVTSGDHLILQSAGTFSGDVTVSGGTLEGSFISAAGLTVSGTGTYQSTRVRTFASLTQTGGTLTGGQTLTITGDYALSGGTVTSSRTPSLVVNTGTFTLSGGTIAADGTVNSAGAKTLSGGTIAGTLGGAGATTVQTGTVTIANTGQILGDVTLASGTLRLEGNTGVTGSITTTGSVIDLADGVNSTVPIVIASDTTQLNVAAGASATKSGVISETGGAQPLEKIGDGTLTLDAVNTYTGATTVSAGALHISGSIASETVIVNGGMLRVFGTALSDTAAVTLSGTGQLELRGSETIGSLLSASADSSVALLANTLTTGRNDTSTTFAGVISGLGGLVKQGTGTLTLTGANTYQGTTTISGGTLQIGAGGTSGILGTGAVINEGRLAFNRSDDLTVSNVISGSGSVTQQGGSMLTLSGANTYTGTTTISAGILRVTGGAAIADTSAVSVGAGTTLDVARSETIGSLAGEGSVTLASGQWLTAGGDNSSTTFSGVISGAGELIKTGSGTLTLSGANTYAGATTVSNGTLDVAGSIASSEIFLFSTGTLQVNGTALSDTATVRLDDASTLRLAGSATIGTLGGTNGTVDLGTHTLTLSAGSSFYNGLVSGTGGVTVTGGTQGLAGSNTFTGAVNVTGGSLGLNGVASTVASVSGGSLTGVLSGSTGLTISDTGTFQSTSAQTIASVTQTGGTLTGTRTLTVSGDYALRGGEVTTSGAPPLVVTAGTFTLSGGTIAAGATVNSAGVKTLSTGTIAGTLGGAGIARITSDGVSIATTGTIASDVEVAAGGTLRISHSDAIGGTITTTGSLLIYGDGVNEASALVIASNTTQLRVLGPEAAEQSGIVSSSPSFGGFEKIGTGRLTLSGTNTYEGLSTVSEGTLVVSNGAGLGASGAGNGTLVADGATLALSGAITTAEAITLNGAGVSDGGALRNLSGENTVTGAITLGSATRITSDMNRIVLQGNISGNQNLTLGGAGEIHIDGNIETGSGTLTKDGTGLVQLGGINTFTGTLAVNTGVLQLASTSDLADSVQVQVASGATLRFLQSDTIGNLSGAGIVEFDNAGITLTLGDATDSTFSGTLDGSRFPGAFTKQGTGALTLSGRNSLTGLTTVSAGTLILTGGSAISNSGAVSVAAGATLRVDQNEAIGALTSLGTVDLSTGNGTPDTVLTVNADHAGGGILRLDAMLGDDTAASDRLIVRGATSGTTSVVVNILGGAGAETAAGIPLVDVAGASAGSFVLANGDAVLPDGSAAITAPGGMYLYGLRNAGGDWRLQSQLQPAAVVYEALPIAMMGLTQGRGLAERLGTRRMVAGVPANGVTASSRGGAAALQTGAWLDIGAARRNVTPKTSTTGLSHGQSTWRIEAGIDTVLSEAAGGTWIGGISAMAGGGTLDAASAIGAGRIETDAVGLGLSATWIGDGGFYTDVQLGWRQFQSNLSSTTAGALATGVRGTGRYASVEVGQRIPMGDLTLTPQAQLSWAQISLDGFTTPGGLAVAAQDAENLRLRLGLAVERNWKTAGGGTARVFGLANVTRNIRDETTVLLATTPLTTRGPKWTADLGLGGAVSWDRGKSKTALFGEIRATRGFAGGKMSGLTGNLGIRVTW
jgi:outer membrane autotransporter protein